MATPNASPSQGGAREPAGPQIPLHTLSYLRSRPKPKWLIHNFMVEGQISLLSAKYASFKTFIALDIAFSIATGIPWQGNHVREGPVIFIAGEGDFTLGQRAEGWEEHHGVKIPDERFLVTPEPFPISRPDVLGALIEKYKEHKPAAIFIDTLAMCAVGLDENDSNHMTGFTNAMRDLAKATGAHVMAIHHNGRHGDIRGSSALPSNVDMHIALERTDDRQGAVIKMPKQKSAPEWKVPMTLRQRLVMLAGGQDSTLVFERIDSEPGSLYQLSGNAKEVAAKLHGFGEEGATFTDWKQACEASGIGEWDVKRARTELAQKGVIDDPEDKPKRGYKYTIRPDWVQGIIEGCRGTNRVQAPLSPLPESEGCKGTHPFRGVPNAPYSEATGKPGDFDDAEVFE